MFIPLSEVTWESARQLCTLHDPKGRLLSIESVDKEEKVSATIQRLNLTDKYFWVGGKQQASRWHWVVGTSRSHFLCEIFVNMTYIKSSH